MPGKFYFQITAAMARNQQNTAKMIYKGGDRVRSFQSGDGVCGRGKTGVKKPPPPLPKEQPHPGMGTSSFDFLHDSSHIAILIFKVLLTGCGGLNGLNIKRRRHRQAKQDRPSL